MGKVFLDLERVAKFALSIKSLLAISRFRGVWLDNSTLGNVMGPQHRHWSCAVARHIQLHQMFDIWLIWAMLMQQ